MATYLLDTSTFSQLVRDAAPVRRRVQALDPGDRLVICTIVRGEVLYGLARLPAGASRAALEAKVATLLASVPCQPVEAEAADHYARLKRAAELAGSATGDNDLWIAAVACEIDATLVAEDTDYRRLPGLRVESWLT